MRSGNFRFVLTPDVAHEAPIHDFEQHVPHDPHARLAKQPHNSDVTHAHAAWIQ